MSLAKNVDFLRSLSKLNGFQGLEAYGRGFAPAVDSPLVETTGFGSNPGALKMLSFVPEHLRDGAPLVVVLHGCRQTAAAYDLGAGWSTLSERYGKTPRTINNWIRTVERAAASLSGGTA